MEFKTFIHQNAIPEWRDYYIDYIHLNSLLGCLKSLRYRINFSTSNHNINCFTDKERELIERTLEIFQTVIKDQIKKFQRFLTYKTEQNLQPILLKLIYNVKKLQESKADSKSKIATRYKIRKETEKFYKEISMVRSYVSLNQKIFFKLANKYKIRFREISMYNWKLCSDLAKEFGHTSLMGELKRLDAMAKVVEITYMEYFHYKHEYKEAMNRLSTLAGKEQFTAYEAYKFGFSIGVFVVCLIMSILILSEAGFFKPNLSEFSIIQFPIFRGAFTLFIYMFAFGVNVYVWEQCNVNYKSVLAFGNHASSAFLIMRRAFMFLACWVVIFSYSALSSSQYFDKGLFFDHNAGSLLTPVVWTPFLIYMLWPNKHVFNPKGRAYFYRVVGQALASILTFANFHVWFAVNQMLSIFMILKDFAYSICYVNYIQDVTQIQDHCFGENSKIIELFIILVPLTFIILLDIKKLIVYLMSSEAKTKSTKYWISVLRYVIAISTVLFSWSSNQSDSLFFAWIIFAALTTIMCIFCDVKYDWRYRDDEDLLRKKLAYNSKHKYYGAIVASSLLRVAWTLSISPFIWTSIKIKTWALFIICILEIIRRVIWNFLAVELEHLKIEGNFNGVKDYDFPYALDLDLSDKKVATAVEHQIGHYLQKGLLSEDHLFNFSEIEAIDQMVAIIDRPQIQINDPLLGRNKTELKFGNEFDEKKQMLQYNESLELCVDLIAQFKDADIIHKTATMIHIVSKNDNGAEIKVIHKVFESKEEAIWSERNKNGEQAKKVVGSYLIIEEPVKRDRIDQESPRIANKDKKTNNVNG